MALFFVLRDMASAYILYSESIDSYYVGSCRDIELRIKEHNFKEFKIGFTRRASDWKLYFSMDNLTYSQSRKIEGHIKKDEE